MGSMLGSGENENFSKGVVKPNSSRNANDCMPSKVRHLLT